LFYEATVTLITKSQKDPTKKKKRIFDKEAKKYTMEK
jgi:hypothetical protein